MQTNPRRLSPAQAKQLLLKALTSWIADQLTLPFHVDKFWPTAVLGALIVGVVSWILNAVIPDKFK